MNFGKEVLTFEIDIIGEDEVVGKNGVISMIRFIGTCNCDLFRGEVLPGGVDTQIEYYGELRTLSARYILQGKDFLNKKCKIFVENNAVLNADRQCVYTVPKIITDSEALSFLEKSNLKGTITPRNKGVTIHIFDEGREEQL